eukprot:2648921-Alexandrium_andersonii.AAC.1
MDDEGATPENPEAANQGEGAGTSDDVAPTSGQVAAKCATGRRPEVFGEPGGGAEATPSARQDGSLHAGHMARAV